MDARSRVALMRLVWDFLGSEFGSRHQQYEKFYAGAPFIVRNHAFRETDWAAFNEVVDIEFGGFGLEPPDAAGVQPLDAVRRLDTVVKTYADVLRNGGGQVDAAYNYGRLRLRRRFRRGRSRPWRQASCPKVRRCMASRADHRRRST